MQNVLFSWIGKNDYEAAKQDGAYGAGAICAITQKRNFDEVILLSDATDSSPDEYISWLSGKIKCCIRKVYIHLDEGNPTNYRAIYEGAKGAVQKILETSKHKPKLTFSVSSGTSAMATIWIILATSQFNAKLIQSSRERGVEDVDFPFEVAADYLPELLSRNEKRIAGLFSDNLVQSDEFDAKSEVMLKLIERARRIAPSQVRVLIQGESGTGKERFAQLIHKYSLRKGKLITINCGAIPEQLLESELFGHMKGSFTGATTDKLGKIEEADGGTLFLDEIGEMPLPAQVKLLRVLQERVVSRIGETVERKVDVRVISATNRNLRDEMANGKFREDLYYRIAVGKLFIPALRERKEDIEPLVDFMLNKANQELLKLKIIDKPRRLSNSARYALTQHTWPGNIRELESTIMSTVLWASHELIDIRDIEDEMQQKPIKRTVVLEGEILNRPIDGGIDLEAVIAEVAKHYLERALLISDGNKTKAKDLLRFKSYQRLDNWIGKYL